MRTSSHGSFRHALAANMHQRASSGVGIIATPTFPYNINSVWNRNQLAGLGGLDITTMAFMAIAAYLVYKNKSRLGF